MTKVKMAEAAEETNGNAGNVSTLDFFGLSGPTFTYTNPEMTPSFHAIYGLHGGNDLLVLLLTN